MSDVNINVGSKFLGKSKAKITVFGSNTVDNIEVRKANISVGFEFDGDQEATSEIYSDEANKVTNVKQKNVNEQKSEITASSVVDGNLINLEEAITATNVKQENVVRPTEPSTSQTRTPVAVLEPRAAKIPRIGSTVVSKTTVGNDSNIFANMGSVNVVKTVKGNITSSISYVGGVPNSIPIPTNLPTDCKIHTNYGDETHVEDIQGDVKFYSDVYVNSQLSCCKSVNNGAISTHTRAYFSDTNFINCFSAKGLGFRIKGHVSIFNQEFKNTEDFRDGSANDVEYLKETFERFGIEPEVKPDLKYKDIVNEITLLSTEDFSTYKLFVCIYMAHGKRNGMVLAADKEFNLKKTIIDPIMGNSTLNGIPKIFITVACRGTANYEECDIEEFDGHILSTADGIDYSNCIFSYSTYEGHVSKRTRNGTYFIQYLCDNINEDNGDTKILSIFAKVNGILADMYKQVPVFETTMADISFRDLAYTTN